MSGNLQIGFNACEFSRAAIESAFWRIGQDGTFFEYLIPVLISVSAPPFNLKRRHPAGVPSSGELTSAAHVIEHRISRCVSRSHCLIDYNELFAPGYWHRLENVRIGGRECDID